jgi:tetratricopeptide (TPR) repeat protein
MRKPIVGILLTTVGALTGSACIQTMRYIEPPRAPSQLPADIFKLPIHIRAEAMKLEMPLLGDKTFISFGAAKSDPKLEFAELIRTFEADPGKFTSQEARNDYGAALVFGGRYAEATKVFLQIESDFPGQYATASNLGTAYELTGDIENAAVWIRKGIERNPESHAGTEWLHLAILAAKQKLKADPQWLADHSVLEGQMGRPSADLERALEYQLNERLYFVRNNDPVMCDLMYQAALVTQSPAKRAYYLKQVPRFGNIRESQLKKLNRS